MLPDSSCQKVYTVSIEDYNTVIELTYKASNDIKENKSNAALQKLLKALQIDSTYRQIYLQLYQVGKLNAENADIIIKALNKGKRIFEEDDELFFYCGEIYRYNSDYDKAIIEFTNAISYSKVNGEDFYLVPYYYSSRAFCFLKKQNYKEALKDYTGLLKLDPESISGLTNRGITYFNLGEKEKACLDWKNAEEKGSEIAKKYFEKNCQK